MEDRVCALPACGNPLSNNPRAYYCSRKCKERGKRARNGGPSTYPNTQHHDGMTPSQRTTLRNKRYIEALKSGTPCHDCGLLYPSCVMEYDHLPGVIKLFEISKYATRSIAAIQDEIDKCELVCANCHRLRTCSRGHRHGNGAFEMIDGIAGN